MRPGIAIAGRAASGKSHLARELVLELERRGRAAQVVSFATELKREVYELYGVKKGDPGSRELLIAHGERRNRERPGYWVAQLSPIVLRLLLASVVPVCDDLRRLPEYEWLFAESFLMVRVQAPEWRRRAWLARQGLDPEFAVSTDPTEVDHESWAFDRLVHAAAHEHFPGLARALADYVVQT